MSITYRGYHISKAYIGWGFHHDSYDGAPDSGDRRCGLASTVDAAKKLIDEIEDDADFEAAMFGEPRAS